MSERLDNAIIFATKAHAGQKRKLTYSPYILHPLEVASIIATLTDDEDIFIAGLLHDTVEDTNVKPEEIRELFGSRVYALVLSETEDKTSNKSRGETWLERKEDSLLMLENTKDEAVRIMWLADKLSNMRSFYDYYKLVGDKLFLELNQKDKSLHKWYYFKIKELLVSLKNTRAYEEYSMLIDKVFGE